MLTKVKIGSSENKVSTFQGKLTKEKEEKAKINIRDGKGKKITETADSGNTLIKASCEYIEKYS